MLDPLLNTSASTTLPDSSSDQAVGKDDCARFASLYGQLRNMAHARLRRHEAFTLLDTSALLHVSFLRVARAGGVRSVDEPSFLAYASHVMRSVIVDAARARLSEIRGGQQVHLSLEEAEDYQLWQEPAAAVLTVHDALATLEASEPRLSKVISLCYFAGMTEQESAVCLGVSERTIRRDAARARLMLRALLA